MEGGAGRSETGVKGGRLRTGASEVIGWGEGEGAGSRGYLLPAVLFTRWVLVISPNER